VGSNIAIEVEVVAISVKSPSDSIERGRHRQLASSIEDAYTGEIVVARLTARPEETFWRRRGHGEGVREGDVACRNAWRHVVCRRIPSPPDHVDAAIVAVLVAHTGNYSFHGRATAFDRNHLAT